jgi:predicted nucleic acid-binding protein
VAEPFLDTNVLVYLLDTEPSKAARSRELLAEGGVIGVQVLNEFAAVTLGKHALRWDQVDAMLEGFRTHFQVEPLTVDTQIQAMELARRHRLPVYDAMILAAAKQAGCEIVYSEDMHDGATIAGLTIRNPF